MLRCGIVGATGYTGVELIKLCQKHPYVQLTALTTRQPKAIPVSELVPDARQDLDIEVRPFSFAEVKKNTDVVFLCLPHTGAVQTAKKFFGAGKVVIDLSADFRLKKAKAYESWYGFRHQSPSLLKQAVYGLPEMNRKLIRTANLISNPGCYPTGAVLGIYPLIKKRLIDTGSIVIDAKSGVSGAGKKLSPHTQFCAVDENFYAYKVNSHQHMPEINQGLSGAAGRAVSVTFVPHLLPIKRGILSTIYLKVKKGIKARHLMNAFNEMYANEPFVRVKGESRFPSIGDVQFTNFCDIGFSLDAKSGRAIIISAIDNLIKGASGQAVQNMNIRCGFPEEEGLMPW